MIPPFLGPRIEKGSAFARDGIKTFNSVVFVVVAPLAGQRQVVLCVSTAPAFGDDVFNRERLNGETQ
jgi:hypothetical protein